MGETNEKRGGRRKGKGLSDRAVSLLLAAAIAVGFELLVLAVFGWPPSGLDESLWLFALHLLPAVVVRKLGLSGQAQVVAMVLLQTGIWFLIFYAAISRLVRKREKHGRD